MKEFFDKAAMQNHPLRMLQVFLEKENAYEQAKEYDKMRFVGYILEIGYDADHNYNFRPIQNCSRWIPRNSLLIMVPSNYENFTTSFYFIKSLKNQHQHHFQRGATNLL